MVKAGLTLSSVELSISNYIESDQEPTSAPVPLLIPAMTHAPLTNIYTLSAYIALWVMYGDIYIIPNQYADI